MFALLVPVLGLGHPDQLYSYVKFIGAWPSDWDSCTRS